MIKTTGDRSQTAPVPGDDSKRQFVKEIEDALSSGHVDLAVHSAKDMPIDLPASLTIAACLPREDPRDCVVLRSPRGEVAWAQVVERLSRPVSIATSSIRRAAQLTRCCRTRASFRSAVTSTRA